MVSRNNSWRLVAVLAALGAAPLAAQAPVRLSFADAVRRAAGEAPTVALAPLRADEADAQGRQGRAGLFPPLSGARVWGKPDFNSPSLGLSFSPPLTPPHPAPP